ncbi:TRAP transporter permease protein [Moorella glycerini]|uniref:Sialic acid TRAP transporter permease protein SiaT n=1 Tax=Neomoorella stamsii TaxID=1266720 RepID=A0A9X7J582_9FIRM|nr:MULTISPECIES: TRAP transporter large permease [Moorella]PRR77106.1 Sialic acid TRAP transporter permease protein SiaT [Moorella stamsii]CEP66855.1 TRAP transporter permease protein [Moorella glycerini]
MVLTMTAVFFIALALAFPLYIGFLMASFVAMVFYVGQWSQLLLMNQVLFGSLQKFSLMAVPFFVFTAEIMGRGGLARRLIDWGVALFGWMRACLAAALTVASMFMGAISGSGPATIAAVGRIMNPVLVREGYAEEFSIGLLCSTAALSVIIPPSIPMIVLGSLTNLSVGALFIGGFIPGVLLGVSYIIYNIWYAKKVGVEPPKTQSKGLWQSTREALWALGVPVIIIGGIYGGVFTPTEASVVAAVYVVLVSTLVYREIGFKKVWEVAAESGLITAQIFIVFAASNVLSWFLTVSGLPQQLTSYVAEKHLAPWALLMVLNIILLIAGMLVDAVSAMTVLMPLLFPILVAAGIDPLHAGLVIVINLAIGLFTPPFGFNLFVAQGALGVPVTRLYRGVMPFIAISVVILLAITYLPVLTVALPNYLLGIR